MQHKLVDWRVMGLKNNAGLKMGGKPERPKNGGQTKRRKKMCKKCLCYATGDHFNI